MKIILEVEPYPWQRPRASRSGVFFNAKGHNKSLKHIKYELRAKADRILLDEPIAVHATFYLPKPKSTKRKYPSVRPDLDNYVKLLLDAGNDYLWLDDNCIVEIHARKLYGNPRIELEIKKLVDNNG